MNSYFLYPLFLSTTALIRRRRIAIFYRTVFLFFFLLQASEGVPIRFFAMLPELVEAYYNPNMGLVTHLQYAVQREEEAEEEQESNSLPPQLPPRNFLADAKESETKTSEQATKSLSDTYLMRLQHIDLSALSEEHQMAVQEYFRTSICLDAEQVQNGNPNLPGLKKLITAVCKNLNCEISRVLPTLEIFHRALDQQLSPGIGPKQVGDSGQSISYRLEQLTKLLYSIEDKVWAAAHMLVTFRHRKSLIPIVSFEVKQELLGISTKMVLKVDVESGKLFFKKSKDGPEDKYFVHNKILQLVKSQKMHAKLIIVVETEKEKILRKEFVFDDTKKREGFCQLLQQMKNKHSEKPEPDMITVFVGTWNMGNAGPPPNIDSWFHCKGLGKTRDDTADHIPHDVYVIGTQEDPLGEREWSDTVKNALRKITNISFKQVGVTVTVQKYSHLFLMCTCFLINDNRIPKIDLLFSKGHITFMSLWTIKNGLSLRSDALVFVDSLGPNSAPQGGIQIMNCVAILLTKSKTRFFIEFHSSCLEKTVKTSEGDNTEQSDGSIKVWFGNKLTPIISDPEYLLEQHILICVKSTDCDESYGEGCVALRAAQFCYREFQITLTHQGEKTGTLTGGIQLRTSEFKPTEKLYDFIKIERDDAAPSKGKGGDKKTIQILIDWFLSARNEDEKLSEMLDNPLYGSMAKSQAKDQGHPQPDRLTPTIDGDPNRPPLLVPRNRSFTSSENRSQPQTPVGLHPPGQKKPVIPSRSDGGMAPHRPPLPTKSRPEPQTPKPRDYRDTSEFPSKQRVPTRPGPLPPQKDSKARTKSLRAQLNQHSLMHFVSYFSAFRTSQDGPSSELR
uniref:Inositol polyphosphate-5-phosphatase D n=1 Tax=Xiphophorus couchianus TaxID=32473 RepID=A0A3B5LAQ2_9TELE